MKFAKELEEDLVPEWRVKYFNYKLGKKKIKAVTRALRSANRSPNDSGQPGFERKTSNDQLPFTHYDFNLTQERSPRNPSAQVRDSAQTQAKESPANPAPHETSADILRRRRESVTMFSRSPPVLMPKPDQSEPQIPEEDEEAEAEADATDDSSSGSENHRSNENTPLQERNPDGTPKQQRRRYGSIVGTPPESEDHFSQLAALNLPDPALDLSRKKTPSLHGPILEEDSPEPDDLAKIKRTPTGADGYWDQQPERKKTSQPKKFFKKRNSHRRDDPLSSRAKLKRAFTSLALDSPAVTNVQFEAWKELDARQADFFGFLDRELNKIEKFYKLKEEEATSRLNILREQLHEMRDRRLEDLTMSQNGKNEEVPESRVPVLTAPFVNNNNNIKVFFDPFSRMLAPSGKVGKTSKAREQLGSPRGLPADGIERDRGDYVRKQQPYEKVPYRNAKRKLKLALQEFYRGLELLKSYALLNRTAFRKINKKYDKAVMARPPLRYMSEKVNNAHFVQSTLIEETLVNIEDLYARYFERGNRKVAVNKLRSHLRQEDQSGVSFRNGLFVALGSGFAISGLVTGVQRLYSEDVSLKLKASYLFQIYAGYFLAVLLFLFFVLDCRIWTRYRVNYTFVFEYDTRHVLDWRELAELPCFFLFLNGLFFWINFQVHHDNPFFVYWPVILIGVTVIVIFLPFKVVYYHARKWWLYSNWRLMLAGLYPVEFRDFFLGDMYCSETYTMSQLEVFFCLYANNWTYPQKCNSNHSKLLGFLTCLPAIWRSFQCLRRYYDSRNWFPHLANFVKYLCNVLYYMSLSLYRIHLNGQMKAMFIVFALINGLYCAFWDIFMDFSLGNPWSKNFLLRDNLAFRRKRFYYAVMVVDFTLRQQWIAYAIFTTDLQHSAVMSFVVALAEVTRRGVWSLFRVENEHCNNVEAFRASRDLPLPYSVPESRAPSIDLSQQPNIEPASPGSQRADQARSDGRRGSDAAHSTATDPERGPPSGTVRPRSKLFNASTPGLSALQRVGTAIATAHAQDFEKKRRPEVLGSTAQMMGSRQSWSDDDDDDDDNGPRDRRSTAIDINRERYLDSREDVRGRRSEDIREVSNEDSNGSGSASSSGERHPPRSQNQRHERTHQTLRPTDSGPLNELDRVREHVNRARGTSDPR